MTPNALEARFTSVIRALMELLLDASLSNVDKLSMFQSVVSTGKLALAAQGIVVVVNDADNDMVTDA